MVRPISTIYEGLPFGWSVIFCAQVEGVQFLFTEADVSASDPSGYTLNNGSLVIDGSARLGSVASLDTGIGKAFEFTLGLRRNPITQFFFGRPGVTAQLAEDLDFSEVTALTLVEDPGFASSGIIHIGREAIAYGFKTAAGISASGFDELNTLTRGMPNGLWRAYSHHVNSQISTWITDTVLYWRGRRVILWACPVDPYGNHRGADILDGASQVFVGHVRGRPETTPDGWELGCESLDRRLMREVGSAVTGQASWELVADPLVAVDPTWTLHFEITKSPSPPYGPDFELDLTPFGPSAAAPLSGQHRLSALRQSVVDEWDALNGNGIIDVDVERGLWIMEADQLNAAGIPVTRRWRFHYDGSTTAPDDSVAVRCQILSGAIPGMVAPASGYFPHFTTHNVPADPATKIIATHLTAEAAATMAMLTIIVDEGDPTELPSSGWIMLEAKDRRAVYQYDSLSISGNKVSVTTVHGSGPALSSFSQEVLEEFDAGKVSAKFGIQDSGLYRDMMRRMLASGGRGDNDGTWDVNPEGGGYDLEVVDFAAFDEILDGGWALASGVMSIDDRTSWQKVFGDPLALSGRCIVVRDDGAGNLLLTPVRTSVYDTALAEAVKITDGDLIILEGSEPVRRVDRPESYNSLVIQHTDAMGEDDGQTIINDRDDKTASGTTKREFKVLGANRSTFDGPAKSWARAAFAERHDSQLFELDVRPDIDAQAGDDLDLDLSHYAIEDRSSGLQGYSGAARCLGRQLHPATSILTLTVMTQGAYKAISLSPSALVLAHTGVPGIGDTIDVGEGYFDLMAAYLLSANPFRLTVYDPSLDSPFSEYDIDGVAKTAGVCRLTVAALIIGPALTDNVSYLTLPLTINSSPAQDRHLHKDTAGAVWR